MSGENTPMSKKGKFSVQNWQSDPMNSPKAFGELKILRPPGEELYSGMVAWLRHARILYSKFLC